MFVIGTKPLSAMIIMTFCYRCLEEDNENVIIMGDFNYPEIDWLPQTVDGSAHGDCKSFLDTVKFSYSACSRLYSK